MNQRFKTWVICGVVCLLSLGYLPTIQAQAEQAGVLRITYAGVSIRRANTSAWLPVAAGSLMPLGIGDALQTNETGRALLTFEDAAEVLILPHSTLELVDFSTLENGQLRLHLRQIGRSVSHLLKEDAINDYQLATDKLFITSPARLFAVQAEAATSVIVQGGTAAGVIGDKPFEIPTGSGLRVGEIISPLMEVPPPASFAFLDALLDGCPGVVNPQGRDALNVRNGPGEGYEVVGIVPKDAPIRIVGMTSAGDRYRIQNHNGFGWVLASGVSTLCQNLPIFPYDNEEIQPSVFEPQPHELELLVLFFGVPEDDLWFYP